MQRRDLLIGAAAAAATLVSTPLAAATRHRVERLEVFRLPVNRRGDWLIVRLRTDAGLVGLGDASHGGDDALTIRYLKRFADRLRGHPIDAIERFSAVTRPIAAAAPAASAIVAASAIEQCLWDLNGHARGLPVSALFGGALRRRVPLYANINRSTEPRTPDGFAAMAERAVAAGFDAVKLAPFDALPADLSRGTDVSALIDRGVASAAAVRAAIGPRRRLLIDAHSRFTRDEGLAVLARLEPLDLYWLEEVTPPADLPAINRAAPMPVAGGEAIRFASGFAPYLRGGAVDVAMPDVKLCGGPSEMKEIGRLAGSLGLQVSPHGPASPIGGVVAAHVAATLPNFAILEHAFGEVPWRADIIDPVEDVGGGALTLSDRPGLGVSLNLRELARRGQLV